ncbi:hypothetical protein EN741_24915 [Mesorhizobium sp. M4B.F.Ca.ET.019.03.1.1]|uniref:hypothetical protein n=1 Tax=Mesorhizobium sp. M4B.F.Ca.ET.019.03.1.1 TaxID=2496651 RepID=UPI000FCCD354|nr:hypothetical protein [Mesorhizobium sp. M4B.F.Ca.ET.019.03.1.1]RVD36780.1 hypothetical protein EN741_24915 [Mesorhizobium sp. M4B.F.Ca.ET.019.03.1.1]
MTFPNPDLGPFEAENNDWAQRIMREFTAQVTQPMLQDHVAAHVALAHLTGFVMAAMSDAGGRGDGQQQIMPDVLEQAMERLKHLFAGTIGVTILEDAKPIFTVVPGGKKDDPAPDDAT